MRKRIRDISRGVALSITFSLLMGCVAPASTEKVYVETYIGEMEQGETEEFTYVPLESLSETATKTEYRADNTENVNVMQSPQTTEMLMQLPLKREIKLEVTSTGREEVRLSWEYTGDDTVADCVTGSAITYMQPAEYVVTVNGETVASVKGTESEFDYYYTLPDCYATYEYQVSRIGEEEGRTVNSNVVSFTSVKRIGENVSKDATWGGAVGSYEITSNITVKKSVSLEIEPGTVLRFASGANLYVYGDIISKGNEGSPVVFTSQGNASWKGIHIYAGGSLRGEYTKFLKMEGEHRKNYTYAGILSCGTLELTDCEIELIGRSGYAIVSADDGSTQITGSTICGCYRGIYVWQKGDGSFVMTESLIEGATYEGMYVRSVGSGTFEVIGNRFERNGTYPLLISPEGLCTGNKLESIKDNSFSGNVEANGITLNGNVTKEVNLPTGEYAFYNLRISAGGVLNIEKGSTICSDDWAIEVSGTLNALGTEEEPVIFTALGDETYGADLVGEESTTWKGIRVYGSGVFRGEHAKILNTSGCGWLNGYWFGVYVDGTVDLSECELVPAGQQTLAVVNAGKLFLKNCNINCSKKYGIYLEQTSGTVALTGCMIAGGETGVYINSKGDTNITISNNTITGKTRAIHGESIRGEFSVVGNTFLNCGNHPLYLSLAYMQTGDELKNIRENTLEGCGSKCDVVLFGTPRNNIKIPKGRYFCESFSVTDGKILTVAPGAQLLFIGNNGLSVNGTLLAEGTETEKIVFSGAWDSEYTGEEGTGNESFWKGISISKTGHINATNCVFRYASTAITASGRLIVRDSVIEKSQYNGIASSQRSGSEITRCTISGGTTGISVGGSDAGSIQITDSKITGCSSNGIYVSTFGTGIFAITENEISGCGRPVYVNLSHFVTGEELKAIQNNRLTENLTTDYITISGPVGKDLTIPKETYQCESISIGTGATVTVEPGAKLYFIAGRGVYVDGTLKAEGTAEEEILFTIVGDQGKNFPKDTSLGTWAGIHVNKTGTYIANNNVLRHGYNCVMINGAATILNSDIQNASSFAVYVDTTTVPVINYCSFTGSTHAMTNRRKDVVVDARRNYWGHVDGPCAYVVEYIVLQELHYRWRGKGAKVEGEVDFSNYFGSAVKTGMIVAKSEGAYAPSGTYSLKETDLSYPCLNGTMEVGRTFSNRQRERKYGILGVGWHFAYDCRIVYSLNYENFLVAELPNGGEVFFEVTENGYVSQSTRDILVCEENGSFILTTPSQEKYIYDGGGRLTRIQEENGNAIVITYNKAGNPEKVTDYAGRVITLEYDDNNFLVKVTDAAGRTVRYEPDALGMKLLSVTTPDNKTTSYRYAEESGYVTAVLNHEGQVTEAIVYDNAGDYKLYSVTDANGNTRIYEYEDLLGQTTITYGDGTKEVQYYDTSYNITGITDRNGETVYYDYYPGADGRTSLGELQSERDELGNMTSYVRDGRGNITKITHPDRGEEIFGYDDKNHCVYHKDQAGVVTRYEYGADGTLLCQIVELDGGVSYSEDADPAKFAITTYTYYKKGETDCNCAGLVKRVTSPEGVVTEYKYDAEGNQTHITNNLGYTTVFEYDEIGRVKKQTTPEEIVTEYEYDKNGNLTKSILAGLETTSVLHNRQGLPVKESKTGYGYTSEYSYTYDAMGNRKSSTDGLNNTTTYTYDEHGNVTTETLPTGAIYHYTYDGKNRVLTVTVQTGDVLQLLKEYTYSRVNGQLQVEETVHADATTRHTTVYLYDSMGRLVQQNNPDGGSLTWKYRKDGLLESETDALGRTTYYRYDALKNCIGIWMPCGEGTYTYQGMTYNRDCLLSTQVQGITPVSNGSVPGQVITLSYGYDGAGRLLTFIDGNETETTYRYDKDGRRVSEEVKLSPTQTVLTKYTYGYRSEPVTVQRITEGGTVLATSYEYDVNGNVTKETAPDGTVTTYMYNAMGSLLRKQVTGRDGAVRVEGCEYDRFGRLSCEKDAEGNETCYEYDELGNLIKVTDAEGGITLYAYNRMGNRTADVSPENYRGGGDLSEMSRLTYLYDYAGRVKAVTEVTVDGTTEEENRIAYYNYDRNGNLTYVQDGNRNKTTYQYTPAGKVASVLTPEAESAGKTFAIRYTYDALGRMLTEETALGGVTTYTYDGADNVRTVTRKTAGSFGEATVTYTYDGMGNVLTETTDTGLVTTYTYDTLGQLCSMTVTGGEGMEDYTETYRYDLGGRQVSVTTSTGAVTTTEYDSFGNVIKQSLSATDGSYNRAETYTYDKNGNKKTYTDREGVTTAYTYDGLNRVTSETVTVSGKVQTLKTEYDANGNVTAETDKFGNRTAYTYDAFDRLTTVVSPEGVVLVRYIYDPAGNCISQTDALGNITRYEYTGSGQVSKTIDGEGNITIQTYDAMGNVATVTDGEDHTTTYVYDGFGRLLSVTAADGTKTSYSYDPWGNLLTQTDGKNNKTVFTYNAANLPLTKTESGTITAVYTYNGDGSVKTMTDAAGTVNTYVYNVHGELVSETATGVDGTKSTYTYTYDKNGNLLSMTDGSGTTTYRYDELGRVTEKDTPEFGKVTYTCDLTSGMEPGCHYELQNDPAGSTRTVYDTRNRVIKVTTQSIEGAPETVEISYYDNGARERVTYGDGSSEYYTFYGNNLVKGVTNKLADGTVIDQFSYVYDGAGNLISKTELANGQMRGTTTYTYDKQNRLKSVTEPDGTVISYTYDGAGNRATETTTGKGVETVKTYTYNGRNQLLSVEQKTGGVATAKISYTYDANGNQLTETQTVYGAATENGNDETSTVLTNTYDLRNQLIKSVMADATIINTYNAAGYRVGKSVTEKGKTSKTYFLYDGSNVIMEADEDGVTAKNTYGGPLLLRTVFHKDGSEETYQYLYNAHGDVITLLANGEVAATYYYDSFGNILEQTGEVDNAILYAGYQYDEETGLYYINARMYDPVTARFLQADTYLGNLNDPLSLNLYTYCLNNPHKYADPSGHSVILALLLVAVVSFAVGAGMEYVNQKFIEKRDVINYDLILFEGVFNAVIAVVSFGTANIGVAAARQGARSVARYTGRVVARTMAFGAAEGAANSIGRQLVEGKTFSEIDYGQVAFDTTLNAVTAGISGYHGANQEIFDNARRATKGNVRKNVLLSVDADDVADLGTPNGYVKVESGNFSNKVYFGQQAVSPNFSPQGTFKGASIQSVADSLTTGKLSADSLPIEYIVRDGKMITMNNRSLTALSKANMKPTILIDITGNAVNEAKLTQRLSEMGGQPSEKILIRKVGEIVHIPY